METNIKELSQEFVSIEQKIKKLEERQNGISESLSEENSDDFWNEVWVLRKK